MSQPNKVPAPKNIRKPTPEEFEKMAKQLVSLQQKQQQARRVPRQATWKAPDRQLWFVVPTEDEWPKGAVPPCQICQRSVQSGEVVFITQLQCGFVCRSCGVKHDSRGDLSHWFVMHKRCLAIEFEEAPKESYDQIVAKLKAGKPLFE